MDAFFSPCADSHQTYFRYLLTFITKNNIVGPLTIESNVRYLRIDEVANAGLLKGGLAGS